jgi:hypothetical protein
MSAVLPLRSHQPNDRQPSDRPVFVVGCPRSGTTMLQLMLHAHPRIAIPPESRFLLAAYQCRSGFGDLTDPDRRRALGRWIVATAHFDDLGLDAGTVIEAIVAAPPTLGSALGTVFQLYADRFGKPRWGDKRPIYLRSLPLVLRLFPDAQIINIVRDGRDCVASLKDTPWGRTGLDDLIDQWARAADAARRAARLYGHGTFHQVRYEDLVAEPETYLRTICRFLGETYHPAMAQPSEQAAVAVPTYKTWHERTHRAVTTDRVRSWQQRLTEDEIRRCESIFGPRLARLGYEPSAAMSPSTRIRVTHAWLAARDRLGPARLAVDDARARLHGHRPGSVAARLTSRQLTPSK